MVLLSLLILILRFVNIALDNSTDPFPKILFTRFGMMEDEVDDTDEDKVVDIV